MMAFISCCNPVSIKTACICSSDKAFQTISLLLTNHNHKIAANISLNAIYTSALIWWFWLIKTVLSTANFEFLSINILGSYLSVWGTWGKNSVTEACWKGKYTILITIATIKYITQVYIRTCNHQKLIMHSTQIKQ